jgi:catechol 2,3-dioxygenase-like lactoylglutathione lyase family enzyme
MHIKGISWVGIKTSDFEVMTRFFRDVLGLRVNLEDSDFVDFDVSNGDTVEVFGPTDHESDHLRTGPVVGFFVDDIAAARAELEASGTVTFFGPTVEGGQGWAWAHFVAPDGNIYEITTGPHRTLAEH